MKANGVRFASSGTDEIALLGRGSINLTEQGDLQVRVRGHAKVFCHLMFGVLALAIDHLMRLIT